MGNVQKRNTWLVCSKPRPGARLRLLCFPYAGGGAQIYQDWANGLSEAVEVYSLQLPGRAARMPEPPFTSLIPLVRTIAQAVLPFLKEPFAFFGYSMGALIGFELARELRRNYGLHPVHFFVAACSAPHIKKTASHVHCLPDPEFTKRIRSLNGTPPDILENEELMNVILPTLRADFALCETYRYTHQPPLDCDMTVFGGRGDQEVTHADLEAWACQTKGDFSLRMFDGDHFFLHAFPTDLQKAVDDKLRASEKCLFSSR